MFRRFYVQKIFVQKVLCSEGSIFRRAYVQKVLCSEGPIFRRSYVLKVLCSEKHCSKGAIFRRFYVQKVLYSNIFRRSYIQKFFFLCRKKLSVSGKLQCKITNHRPDELLSWRVVRRPQFAKIAMHGTSINIVKSHKPGVITEG